MCFYRSSFYSDVLQHFASFHRESCYLLCVFCLKVTRNPVSYQQHLLRHQVTGGAPEARPASSGSWTLWGGGRGCPKGNLGIDSVGILF